MISGSYFVSQLQNFLRGWFGGEWNVSIMNIGYGLSREEAEWWSRYEIYRYGNLHAESKALFFSDVLDYIVSETRSIVTAQSLSEFSKIVMNTVSSHFQRGIDLYLFLTGNGVEIMQFLCQHSKSGMTYKLNVISKFVDMNLYCKCGSILDMVSLFPDETVSDHTQLVSWIESVIRDNEKAVADFKRGKTGALNSLKGQVMKLSGGKANINLVGDLLKERMV